MMTEEEKIFARKMFDPRKQELKDIKHKAHIACQKYNTMDEYDPERSPIIQEFIGKIGKVYYFQGPIQFNYGSHTFIGENFFANFNLTVLDCAKVIIGDNCLIGPCVKICAAEHPLNVEQRIKGEESAREIAIGNNVWIGAGAIINPGVNIGDNCVIGSGAVVTKSIPNDCVAVGVPAKVIKQLK